MPSYAEDIKEGLLLVLAIFLFAATGITQGASVKFGIFSLVVLGIYGIKRKDSPARRWALFGATVLCVGLFAFLR